MVEYMENRTEEVAEYLKLVEIKEKTVLFVDARCVNPNVLAGKMLAGIGMVPIIPVVPQQGQTLNDCIEARENLDKIYPMYTRGKV